MNTAQPHNVPTPFIDKVRDGRLPLQDTEVIDARRRANTTRTGP